MTDAQRRELETILESVHIDENTNNVIFDVIEGRGSIAILKQAIEELTQFQDGLGAGDFLYDVTHKLNFLNRIYRTITDGTYFPR
jgi:hypothetical protein